MASGFQQSADIETSSDNFSGELITFVEPIINTDTAVYLPTPVSLYCNVTAALETNDFPRKITSNGPITTQASCSEHRDLTGRGVNTTLQAAKSPSTAKGTVPPVKKQYKSIAPKGPYLKQQESKPTTTNVQTASCATSGVIRPLKLFRNKSIVPAQVIDCATVSNNKFHLRRIASVYNKKLSPLNKIILEPLSRSSSIVQAGSVFQRRIGTLFGNAGTSASHNSKKDPGIKSDFNHRYLSGSYKFKVKESPGETGNFNQVSRTGSAKVPSVSAVNKANSARSAVKANSKLADSKANFRLTLKANSGSVYNAKACSGSLPKAQSGSAVRAHPGLIAKAHSGSISTKDNIGSVAKAHPESVAKAHPGSAAEAHPGSAVKAHPGLIAKVHSGSVAKVHSGSVAKVHSGSAASHHCPTSTKTQVQLKVSDSEKCLNWICGVCDLVCKHSSHLRVHLYAHDVENMPQPQPTKTSKSSGTRKRSESSSEVLYACDQCWKVCQNRIKYTRQLKGESHRQPFCDICGLKMAQVRFQLLKKFADSFRHQGTCPLECVDCGKFFSKNSLETHLRFGHIQAVTTTLIIVKEEPSTD